MSGRYEGDDAYTFGRDDAYSFAVALLPTADAIIAGGCEPVIRHGVTERAHAVFAAYWSERGFDSDTPQEKGTS